MHIAFAFIRHGAYEQPPDTPGAHLPHPLTADGERQARDAAPAVLAWADRNAYALHPVIDSSSVLRAWQTASALADELSSLTGRMHTVASHDALAERSVGAAANLTMEQIEAIVARDPRLAPLPEGWKLDSRFRLPFPGAESLLDSGERVLRHVTATLDELEQRVAAATLKLFVGHGGSFRHAAVAMGLLAAEDTPLLSMHHCEAIYFARESGCWRHLDGSWKVRSTVTAEGVR